MKWVRPAGAGLKIQAAASTFPTAAKMHGNTINSIPLSCHSRAFSDAYGETFATVSFGAATPREGCGGPPEGATQ